MSLDDAYADVLFIHWTSYVCLKAGTIIKEMPLVLRPGVEPPETAHRNGIVCQRVAFDVDKRFVAYAFGDALVDIRTTVDLIRAVVGEQDADAQAETRSE